MRLSLAHLLAGVLISTLLGCTPEPKQDRPGPRIACERYLGCAAAVAPASVGALLDAFGPEGSCWDSGETESLCMQACVEGRRQLQLATPGVDACEPCEVDEHCVVYRSGDYCHPVSLDCVACASDDDCEGDSPACDTTTGACVACTSHEHCPGACKDNVCVECTNASHCGEGGCANSSCVECTASQHCGTAGGCVGAACVECSAPEHCETGACLLNECVACQPDSTRCVAGQPVDEEVCLADGRGWSTQSCHHGETCREGGCTLDHYGPCNSNWDCLEGDYCDNKTICEPLGSCAAGCPSIGQEGDWPIVCRDGDYCTIPCNADDDCPRAAMRCDAWHGALSCIW